jgi:protein-S-isoprenylcysteine O-methyltransferase Ste14
VPNKRVKLTSRGAVCIVGNRCGAPGRRASPVRCILTLGVQAAPQLKRISLGRRHETIAHCLAILAAVLGRLYLGVPPRGPDHPDGAEGGHPCRFAGRRLRTTDRSRGGVGAVIAVPLAWVPALRVPTALVPAVFLLGVAAIVAAGLLRRHCWRLLGASFTGDVRARPDQAIVTTGAYALLRHPSYSAGILMNTGFGLALGSWASTLLLALVGFAVYGYRIAVEERTLLAVVGEPYREFMRTRRRLIPFLY